MKHLSFICTFLLALTFSACTYNYNTYTEGETQSKCYFNTKTVKLVVEANKWALTDDGNLVASIDVPEITQEVYRYGAVNCYLEFNPDTKDAFQVALPHIMHCSETREDQSINYYTQTVNFFYGVGFVDIYLTNSDFSYAQEDYVNRTFYLQLQW